MFMVGFSSEQFEFHHFQRSNGCGEGKIELRSVAVDHALKISGKGGDLFWVGHDSEEMTGR
jgi:hypothetical protein